MEHIVTVFKLGSSTVVTLPKILNLRSGQKLGLKKEKKRIVLIEKRLDAAKIAREHAGNLSLKYHPTIHEMKRMYDEEVYKLPHEKK